jgi:hypothetical protein
VIHELHTAQVRPGSDLHRHPETHMRLDELGKRLPPYRPTYDFPGPYIDGTHRSIGKAPLSAGIHIQLKSRRWFGDVIPGKLRREDALKLYELAYFSRGDILELGSFHGLSTSILARASANSPYTKHVTTVDLARSRADATRSTLESMRLSRLVTVLCDDGAAVVGRFASQGRRFGFIFVDHSHAYEAVYDVSRRLADVILPGGFCLFHDFNDSRNRDVSVEDYGVYTAVIAGLDSERFAFFGIYGCAGLYRLEA